MWQLPGREAGRGRGASRVPRQARLRRGDLGGSSCAAGARETGAAAGTCPTAAPGVKVNLKPSPSRLSKQKQRPDLADEYSLAQKSNPSAPAPTQKPGSSRDHLSRKRKPQGKSGAGETRKPLSCFPILMGLAAPAPTNRSQGHPHPFHASKKLRPSPARTLSGRCPRHNRERVKCRCSLWPGGTDGRTGQDGVHPSSFELLSRNQSLVKLVGRPVPRLSAPPQSSMLRRRAQGGGLQFPPDLKDPFSRWGMGWSLAMSHQPLQTQPPSNMSRGAWGHLYL